jgi:hypothetical protein
MKLADLLREKLKVVRAGISGRSRERRASGSNRVRIEESGVLGRHEDRHDGCSTATTAPRGNRPRRGVEHPRRWRSSTDGGVRPRTVALYQGLAAGSLVVTGLLFELLFRNPPVERGSTQVGGTIAGVGWLHDHPVAVKPSIHTRFLDSPHSSSTPRTVPRLPRTPNEALGHRARLDSI